MSNYWRKKLNELNGEQGITDDYWKNKMSELEKENAKKDDIAPIRQTDTTKKEKKWYEKIFNGSSYFDDGYQFGDVSKTLTATGRDLQSDVRKGFLGLVETAIDTGAGIIGNVGGRLGADGLQDTMAKFIAKDIINEDKVAKGLDFINGGFLTDAVSGTSYDEVEDQSVLGDTADGWAQSGGQLLGQIALQSVGVPWYVTSATSSYGGEMENALNQGATFDEANLSATFAAASEIVSEKLFGGSGLGEKGLINMDWFTKGISNKIVKLAADVGLDVFGEGMEEVASGLGSAVGQKLSYASDKELSEIFSKEDAFEAFVGGAILSGFANSGKVVNSAKTGRDYRTGLTENEQKVFDKVYEDAIAEATEGGKELTKKQKAEIYDEVMKSLQRGEVDTDTIESILGGEEYKAYKDTIEGEESLVKQKEALQEEFDALNKMKLGERTGEQTDRLEEVRGQIKELNRQIATNERNGKSDQLKSQLSKNVQSQLVRQDGKKTLTDDYLIESYNEKARKGQAYDADLSQYSEKQQETIKKAIDSGFLNNTRKTHKFIDMLAKIHEDKGVDFDLLNNERLKESSYAVDGKYVNGYYDKKRKTIGLNFDSAKYMNNLAGHEITHVFEGTDAYNELQNAVFEYAKAKGEYDSRRESLKSLYSEEDIDTELTADLVGDYLFTDSDFIANLSTKHRNIFQKIWDEIKYLWKIATAGSKEKSDLEKAKRAFEKAYRENIKMAKTETKTEQPTAEAEVDEDIAPTAESNSDLDTLQAEYDAVYKQFISANRMNDTDAISRLSERLAELNQMISAAEADQAFAKRKAQGDVKFSFSGKTANGIEVYETSQDVMNLTWDERKAKYLDVMKNEYQGRTAKFERNGHTYYATFDQGSLRKPIYGDKRSSENGKKALIKAGADGDVFDLVENSAYKGSKQNTKDHTDADYFDYFVKTVQIDGKVFDLIADVEKKYGGDGGYVYTLALRDNKTIKASPTHGSNPVHSVGNAFSNDIIPQNSKKSSGSEKFSLSDSEGKQLTKEQSDYFKDSKVRDENGNLKVMYHGTPNGDFTVFKDGTYFTENKWYADLYQNPGASSISTGKVATNPKTFEVYLDIKKPFDISDPEARSIYINDYIKGGNAVGINPYLSDAEYNKIKAIDWTEGEDLRDFLIDNGYDYDGLVLDEGAVGGYGDEVKQRGKSYVVFSPEQVKNVDNVKPTSDPDIRFSLSKSVEETKDLVAVHNIKPNELLKALELGGMPMPSIAIIKADAGHEMYGDISLVFPKETIDPQANRDNKVYGGDAWTPTYPRMEYKANEAVEKRIRDKYNALESKYGHNKVRALYDYVYELETVLNRRGGEEALKEEVYDDTRMMQVYLLDSGKGEVPMVTKEIRTELTDHEVSMYEFFAQKLGAEVIDGVNKTGLGSPIEQRKAYWENHGDAIKEAYGEFLSKEFDFSKEDIQNVLANMKTADFLKVVRDAKKYQTNGRVTTKTEDDYQATQEAIRKAAGEGYKAWVDELFAGSVEKSGIRNNVDAFTRSGNRRGWDALHWENTLENVVKAMKQQDSTGSEAVFAAHKFFAASSKDYKSVAEIKSDSERLHKISDGEYQAAKDSFESRLHAIANRIMDKTESNPFMATENAMECIVDAIRHSKTKAGILKELQQYKQLNVTEADVDDIVSLVSDIANMPTGYFEAKPRRAVSFDEVSVFVIPNNADVKLKQELLNRGYAIAEYDPDVEGSRQKVVNSFEEYKFSLSDVNETPKRYGNYNVLGKDMMLEQAPIQEEVAPVQEGIAENATTNPTVSNLEQVAVDQPEDIAPVADTEESTATPETEQNMGDFEAPIITTKQKLKEKQRHYQEELDKNKRLHEEAIAGYDEKIAKAQAEYDAKKDKTTKTALALARRIERLKRLKGNRDADFKKAINDIESRMAKNEDQLWRNHDRADRLEEYKRKAEKRFEAEKSILTEEFEQKKAALRDQVEDKNAYISNRALELYNELSNLKKGVRASKELGYLLDHGYDWNTLKSTLLKVNRWSDKTINPDSVEESVIREMLNEEYEGKVYELDDIDTEYDEKVEALRGEFQKNYESFKVANQRMTKQREYSEQMEELVGDTSTWVDKKMGLSYKVNTLKRNLRDIVRDANGNRDIAKADAIYDELQGKYNQHEASLNRESNQIKKPYANMEITKAEDAYIQMLGEFRHNPDTKLTEKVVNEFYEKNKDNINVAKVDKAIEMARETYDSLLERVNEVLREQGMKEIPYRKGYFPHFTEEKQGFLAKLLNWKTQNNDIPTDIAGLTEQFNPNRSWQSFNKRRTGDTTDYSFTKGLDSYVHGALDWIYHIEDIQKRRALENHIRYIHSDKGVKEKIDAIRKNDNYDADEMQEQIDLVYKTAGNPLNNFVTDLRAGTNRLANKKSSMDRGMEEMTNRKIYSTMTNISNRVTANMVAGSVSSALTNFIPITQSWGEVSPLSSLRAMGDTIRSIVHDDGMVDKSDFLTNRLRKEENLYKTNWDKIGDKLGLLMEGIDNFTAQTVWRSKYQENISKGMSENEAIKNADQFAAGVMADRSRGNMPTIFDSKNPLIKTLTAFQLEVNNQYGYMFKDMPQDIGNESKAKLVKGYVGIFLGAYAYNALYSSLTGRNAAFDPINIVKELLEDLGLFGDDEEEETSDAFLNLGKNIAEEIPFVGGLLGGGRIPISSALPDWEGLWDAMTEEDKEMAAKKYLNALDGTFYYGIMPMGGGQLKKTIEGLSMFSDEHPIAGSYTESGKLRYAVEDTLGNRIQAGIFGQYANKNARQYFDEDRSPLTEKQTRQLANSGLSMDEYWDYQDGLRGLGTLAEKADYISELDLPMRTKNDFINYFTDRKEDIDLTNYDDYGSFEEFDYAEYDNPEMYSFLKENGISYEEYDAFDEDSKKAWSWAFHNPEKHTMSKAIASDVVVYRGYAKELSEIKADKDENGDSIRGSRKDKVIDYVNGLDADYGEKIILFKSEYNADDTYNEDIIDYLNGRNDISYEEMEMILKELGFEVDSEGNIYW